jgi:hypothetical protein
MMMKNWFSKRLINKSEMGEVVVRKNSYNFMKWLIFSCQVAGKPVLPKTWQ